MTNAALREQFTYSPPLATGLRYGDAYLDAQLDGRDADAPGCYALRLSVPEELEAAWDATFDVRHRDLPILDATNALYYVGYASSSIRERLHDHADRDVRQARIMEVCPPHAVFDIWPGDAEEMERQRAYALSTDRVAVWVNGDVV